MGSGLVVGVAFRAWCLKKPSASCQVFPPMTAMDGTVQYPQLAYLAVATSRSPTPAQVRLRSATHLWEAAHQFWLWAQRVHGRLKGRAGRSSSRCRRHRPPQTRGRHPLAQPQQELRSSLKGVTWSSGRSSGSKTHSTARAPDASCACWRGCTAEVWVIAADGGTRAWGK